MQSPLTAMFAALALLTALPSVSETIEDALDEVSLALAEATGHVLVLEDWHDVSLRLAFAPY